MNKKANPTTIEIVKAAALACTMLIPFMFLFGLILSLFGGSGGAGNELALYVIAFYLIIVMVVCTGFVLRAINARGDQVDQRKET